MLDSLGQPSRVLLLGGTSEIGTQILLALGARKETEVLLAGRDEQRLAAAGKALPYNAATVAYDAAALDTHEAVIGQIFAAADVDIVISAAGILVPQDVLDHDPRQAGLLIDTNFTGHVTTLLAVAGRMRAQGHGVIIVLSSVAAVRPRKANLVYGAAKAGLDAFARGLADSLHGTGGSPGPPRGIRSISSSFFPPPPRWRRTPALSGCRHRWPCWPVSCGWCPGRSGAGCRAKHTV